jgi:PTS system fructose-specific IIC component
MQYLQNISLALLNETFVHTVLSTSKKTELLKQFELAIAGKIQEKPDTTKSTPTTSQTTKGLIVGVSACATGIAHTYMARSALEEHAKDVGYDVWIETQGQSGQEHPLTEALIAKADCVVIAADINVELDRFVNKKIYVTDSNEAINTPVQVLNKAINSTKIYGQKDGDAPAVEQSFGSSKNGILKHFLSGVSHMIPFIVFSGIVWAIINAITIGYFPNTESADLPDWLQKMQLVAQVGFTLFIGVMGGYIAHSIGGRAALAPGFIGSFVASNTSFYIFYKGLPSSFSANIDGRTVEISGISLAIFAALIMGFAAGYLVKWVNSWRVPKPLRPVMPIIFIPVVCSSVLVFPFVFGLSGVLGCMMNGIGLGLAIAGTIPGVNFLIGFVLGAMVGFDMGGPINKIAVATATALIPLDPRLMGAVAAAIPIAPLGCGLAANVFGRKLFSENERSLGISALGLGFFGISEGAIPFAAQRPKQTIICNVIASALAGGLAFVFFVGGHVGMWGGPIIAFTAGIYSDSGKIGVQVPAIFGGGSGSGIDMLITTCWYFLAIGAGAILHGFIYSIAISSTNSKRGFFKVLKERFSKKKIATDNNRVSKFVQWYQPLITENWYYKRLLLKTRC